MALAVRHAPFAVLVLPYAVALDGTTSFVVFRPASQREPGWHALAGDGVRGELPLDAARREACDAAGVPSDAAWLALDSRATVEHPATPRGVPEFAFGVRVIEDEVRSPRGRLDHRWVSYELADGLLDREADRNALYELRRRLGRPAGCC
ncbi:MAG: dihydroneopterin triphosphate diphosphatase [Solirubrobacteraceae bacterium]|jgi:hypothetical protein|nr:dihydroneopterin triphosphate diphosphatase [Solirubrobacteraceae bacterium]